MNKLLLILLLIIGVLMVGMFTGSLISFEVEAGLPRTKIVIAPHAKAWYGVKPDFICDGKADQKEIQKALSLLAKGGVLEILPGDFYKSTDAPMLVPSNLTILMRGVTIHQADVKNADQEMVFANNNPEKGNSNIHFIGGKIAGTAYMAMNFDNVYDLTFEDMEFEGIGQGFDIYGVAVKIWRGDDIRITHCLFHDGRTGLYYSGTTRGKLEGSTFHDQFYVGAEISIEYTGGDKFFDVIGNHFAKNKTALILLCASYVSAVANTFDNNSFRNIEVITGENDNDANFNVLMGNIHHGGKYGEHFVYSHYNTSVGEIFDGVEQPIFAESANYNNFSVFKIYNAGKHGLAITGTENHASNGDIYSVSLDGLNDYSGAVISGYQNRLNDITVRNYEGMAAYGVRNRADAEGTRLIDLDLQNSSNLQNMRDEGTGTIIEGLIE